MKEETFKVTLFIRELIQMTNNYLVEFPKKDLELKTRIKNIEYDILEEANIANTTFDNNVKKENIILIIAKLKTLDFLINECYDNKYINSKKYVVFGNKMDDILKYATGWLKTLEPVSNKRA